MPKPTRKSPDIERSEAQIAGAAEAYPNVIETGPWGHRAFKIGGKTFLFLSADGEGLSFSVKLPITGKAALGLRFAEPTHYGLGKSGWVTARFAPGEDIPLPKVLEWVDESFRAIAPKKVVNALAPSLAQPSGGAKKSSPKKVAAEKLPPKKAAAKEAPAKRVAAPRKSAAKDALAKRSVAAKKDSAKNAPLKKTGANKARTKRSKPT
ncbi:MAG TPA: MmcQ/YjbR family DNA-binding protein [Polyangiaceae bacterium]|nr:MmcQ/YjbR family DNA-binding protein [Polyangiaceae bacterium]